MFSLSKKAVTVVSVVAITLGVFAPLSVRADESEAFGYGIEYTPTFNSETNSMVLGTFHAEAGKVYKFEGDTSTKGLKLYFKNSKFENLIDGLEFNGTGFVSPEFQLAEGDYVVTAESGESIWSPDSGTYSNSFILQYRDAESGEDTEANNSLTRAVKITEKSPAKGYFSYSDLDDFDIDYYKYSVKNDGLMSLKFSLNNPEDIKKLNRNYGQSALLVMNSKKQLVDSVTINDAKFETRIGVKKGTYYIIPVLCADYSTKMFGVGYKINVSHKASNKFEKEYNGIAKAYDKIGVEAKINFSRTGLYHNERVDGLRVDHSESYPERDVDYIGQTIKKSGTYRIAYKYLDDDANLSNCKAYAFVNGNELDNPKFKLDANGNLSLTIKLKKGDQLRCKLEAYSEEQPLIWYKSSIKKIR